MKQEQKLMTGAVLLVALGIGVYASRTSQKKEADRHTVTAAADMPTIKLSAEDAEKITKLVINNKDKGEVTLQVGRTARYVPAIARHEADAFSKGQQVGVVDYRDGVVEVVSREEFEFLTDS